MCFTVLYLMTCLLTLYGSILVEIIMGGVEHVIQGEGIQVKF
jgi:hypothetical protein